jgi:hypothetical protein
MTQAWTTTLTVTGSATTDFSQAVTIFLLRAARPGGGIDARRARRGHPFN